MSAVSVSSLSKSYVQTLNGAPSRVRVIDALDLNVSDGQFVAFFGPNGCGKTTFLSLVAGLLEPDGGTVRIGGAVPRDAVSGFIFQNYRDSLLPWLSTLDNVALPLKLQGISRSTRRHRAREHLRKLEIAVPPDAYPYQLSGGQQQLVAIARALIVNVDVLLFDEPFAALDYTTRLVIRDAVLHIWSLVRSTVLFVSHSADEALYMADRLVLLGSRPMRVIADIPVDLERPRRPDILQTERFFQLQSHVLRLFHREVGR